MYTVILTVHEGLNTQSVEVRERAFTDVRQAAAFIREVKELLKKSGLCMHSSDEGDRPWLLGHTISPPLTTYILQYRKTGF